VGGIARLAEQMARSYASSYVPCYAAYTWSVALKSERGDFGEISIAPLERSRMNSKEASLAFVIYHQGANSRDL
jgi:hypothetical protein